MKLLIMRCSKRKFNVENKRAIEVYDGTNFRILRKFYPIPDLDVRIISAKYGMISPETIISDYNVTIPKLSESEKEDLSVRVTKDVAYLLEYNPYDEIFLDLGKDYLDIIGIDFSRYNTIKEYGGIGKQLLALSNFLQSFRSSMKDFEIEF